MAGIMNERYIGTEGFDQTPIKPAPADYVPTVPRELLDETPNQQRERNNSKPEGAWFVYAYDNAAYPIGLFAEEIDALRVVEHLGYAHAIFWPFGVTWDEIKDK